MIRQMRAVLGPEHQRTYTQFLVWASLYGILQGATVTTLLPLARALFAGDWPGMWRWLAVLAGGVILTSVAHYVQAMKGFTVALAALRTMHLNIGDHLVTLPLGWFTGRVAEIAQIASKGTLGAGSAAAHLMTPIVVGIASPATVAVLMFFFDWRLGIVLALSAPLVWWGTRVAGWFIARGDARTHAAEVEASDRVIEFARNQRALRAFGRTGSAGYAPLERAIAQQSEAVRASLVSSVTGLMINTVVVQLVFAALVVTAAFLALGGSIDGIELLALLGIATRFVQPLTEIGEFGGAMRQARAELARIQGVMDVQPLPAPSASAALDAPGAIEFDGVTFGYEQGKTVIRDVSFTAPPRSITALVGPSGSGKTTITSLIARFFDVDAGVVRVGGADVRDQTTEDLMRQLALVFQDVYLFDDTLRENIRLGNPDASDADVEEAAALAGVTEIAERLPEGWSTRVGEGGSALSGGERQRVSIARALLKNAPIVLLDEATAALDPENERFVGRSLTALREDATLVIIAHKLTTVTSADQILVLDEEGRIAERGTHTQLLATSGRYADFWNERSRAAGWRLVKGVAGS